MGSPFLMQAPVSTGKAQIYPITSAGDRHEATACIWCVPMVSAVAYHRSGHSIALSPSHVAKVGVKQPEKPLVLVAAQHRLPRVALLVVWFSVPAMSKGGNG